MSDLIRREDVIEEYIVSFGLTIEDIERIPAVDAEPVRHGRWVKTIGENGVTDAVRCNICGFEDNRYELFSYCPNCGAKMDEFCSQ